MDHLKLTLDTLSVDAISDLVVDPSCGAVSIFVGTTRDTFEDKKVRIVILYFCKYLDFVYWMFYGELVAIIQGLRSASLLRPVNIYLLCLPFGM